MADNKNEFITESLIVNNVRVCYTQHLFKRDEPFRWQGRRRVPHDPDHPEDDDGHGDGNPEDPRHGQLSSPSRKARLPRIPSVKAVKDGKDGIVGKDFGYPLLDGDKFVAKSDTGGELRQGRWPDAGTWRSSRAATRSSSWTSRTAN
ncbi:MAG: hypothetical protein ACLRL4_10545 [Bifidobacterium bifidum]